MTPPRPLSNAEQTIHTLDRYERDWANMNAKHAQQEQEHREQGLQNLREYIQMLTRERRSYGIKLTNFVTPQHTLQNLVDLEDMQMSNVSTNLVKHYANMIRSIMENKVEAAQRQERQRQ